MLQKLLRQRKLKKILSAVDQVDDVEITQITTAIIRRYHLVHPDWEVLFLSLPKDPEKRHIQLEQMLELLK